MESFLFVGHFSLCLIWSILQRVPNVGKVETVTLNQIKVKVNHLPVLYILMPVFRLNLICCDCHHPIDVYLIWVMSCFDLGFFPSCQWLLRQRKSVWQLQSPEHCADSHSCQIWALRWSQAYLPATDKSSGLRWRVRYHNWQKSRFSYGHPSYYNHRWDGCRIKGHNLYSNVWIHLWSHRWIH